MTALLVLAVLSGLDNLQVAAALGVAPLGRSGRAKLALGFGVWETVMPLAGLLVGRGVLRALGAFAGPSGLLELGLLAACGVAILALSLLDRDAVSGLERRLDERGWLLYGLPVSLSFDNLLAGVALGSLGYPLWLSAGVVGGVSALLSLLGLALGGRLRRFLPGETGAWSGAFLIALALLRGLRWVGWLHTFGGAG